MRIFAGVFFCLTLFGCASQVKVEPVLLGDQERIFRDGVPAVISKKGLVVLVAPVAIVRDGEEQPKFVVSVANTTQANFELDTTNFSALVDGKPLKIYTHAEIESDIKSKQAWAAVAVALGGAMQAASAQQAASNRYTTGTYNSTTQGNFNTYGKSNLYGNYNANTVGTYSGWTYDPAAGQAAANAVNAQTSSQLNALQQQGQAALNVAASSMLKITTVAPGTSYGGQIVLATFDVPDSGVNLDLSVLVAGEEHRFRFVNQRLKK
jgi:hypothetical protein